MVTSLHIRITTYPVALKFYTSGSHIQVLNLSSQDARFTATCITSLVAKVGQHSMFIHNCAAKVHITQLFCRVSFILQGSEFPIFLLQFPPYSEAIMFKCFESWVSSDRPCWRLHFSSFYLSNTLWLSKVLIEIQKEEI